MSVLGKLLRPASTVQLPERLKELTDFGSNPGHTRMFAHIPRNLARNPPLVIALHGYSQSAAIYDRGSGWSTLADEHGFLVVYPEQQRASSPEGGFSWFVPGHVERDRGEALSIRQIIEYTAEEFGVDRRRVFVTGFCAGGSMASAMLAIYPELFHGGAIIAGLPYGCATTVAEAFETMFGTRTGAASGLGDCVRAASRYAGPWPKISVWHGSADTIVKPSNADDIVQQWVEVHGLKEEPDYMENAEDHFHGVWENADGEPVIEAYMISDMDHGVPISLRPDPESCGAEAPYFIPVGISSSRRIAQFWGLGEAADTPRVRPEASVSLRLDVPDRVPV
jgi:poly(hydroxyalkanoate) depolymerase family esterase